MSVKNYFGVITILLLIATFIIALKGDMRLTEDFMILDALFGFGLGFMFFLKNNQIDFLIYSKNNGGIYGEIYN